MCLVSILSSIRPIDFFLNFCPRALKWVNIALCDQWQVSECHWWSTTEKQKWLSTKRSTCRWHYKNVRGSQKSLGHIMDHQEIMNFWFVQVNLVDLEIFHWITENFSLLILQDEKSTKSLQFSLWGRWILIYLMAIHRIVVVEISHKSKMAVFWWHYRKIREAAKSEGFILILTFQLAPPLGQFVQYFVTFYDQILAKNNDTLISLELHLALISNC